MPMILSRLDLFNGQRTGTLATRTPDDVESPPAEALDQAGADGEVLFDAHDTQEVTHAARGILPMVLSLEVAGQGRPTALDQHLDGVCGR